MQYIQVFSNSVCFPKTKISVWIVCYMFLSFFPADNPSQREYYRHKITNCMAAISQSWFLQCTWQMHAWYMDSFISHHHWLWLNNEAIQTLAMVRTFTRPIFGKIHHQVMSNPWCQGVTRSKVPWDTTLQAQSAFPTIRNSIWQTNRP